MEAKRLTIDPHGSVVYITLNRPEVHNAFDDALISELTHAFREVGASGARVMVLSGAGSSFCAGADLEYMGRMAHYTREENLEDARRLQEMLAALAECPCVTLAKVNGAAMGGGAGLVAACDLAVALPEAKFAFSEVRLGLIPAVISPYVVEKIGVGAARALFVTGERFDAEQALRLGLVQQVVPAEELDAAVARKARQALQVGPGAVVACKRLLRELPHLSAEETARVTVERIADLRAGAEGQEGIHAFLEKRKPSFVEEGEEMK